MKRKIVLSQIDVGRIVAPKEDYVHFYCLGSREGLNDHGFVYSCNRKGGISLFSGKYGSPDSFLETVQSSEEAADKLKGYLDDLAVKASENLFGDVDIVDVIGDSSGKEI